MHHWWEREETAPLGGEREWVHHWGERGETAPLGGERVVTPLGRRKRERNYTIRVEREETAPLGQGEREWVLLLISGCEISLTRAATRSSCAYIGHVCCRGCGRQESFDDLPALKIFLSFFWIQWCPCLEFI